MSASTTEMIERVARAVKTEWPACPLDDAGLDRLARAAIAAMREPTNEMVWAAAKEKDRGSWWRVMIDAALADEQSTGGGAGGPREPILPGTSGPGIL
jgi:hypothetical protein